MVQKCITDSGSCCWLVIVDVTVIVELAVTGGQFSDDDGGCWLVKYFLQSWLVVVCESTTDRGSCWQLIAIKVGLRYVVIVTIILVVVVIIVTDFHGGCWQKTVVVDCGHCWLLVIVVIDILMIGVGGTRDPQLLKVMYLLWYPL